MLFGSVTLGAIWWLHFANLMTGGAKFSRVISLCGDLSLGMLSLGIIGLLSIALDNYRLKFIGLSRLPSRNSLSEIAVRVSELLSRWGAVLFIVGIALWALWVYFKSPIAPFDVFVFSIPLGLIWETAGKRS